MDPTTQELLFRGYTLDGQIDRGALIARIGRALDLASQQLGLRYEHDGAETAGDVTYTVWTDDPQGATVTSWVRLTDDLGASALYLEVNATTDAILEATCALLSAHVPVLGEIADAPRPY